MREITYGSICSGIEAATTAWHPLGWSPRWFSEIEPFPSAVLAHHWPQVPNLGDFTIIRDKIAAGVVDAPDVLVGGTPCQAFSVAGLRQSLDDKRGQLTLEFVRLADAIDSARSFRGKCPVTVVWENVPGVLNTPDNAFGCFLAGLVGEDDPLEPPGGRWTSAGYVRGPRRAVAWRILDAQYFGVAQRRRRVFLVASAGGLHPEQILFELEGVRRDSPPSREKGQEVTQVAGTLAANGGGLDSPAGNANELDFCIPVNGSHWDGDYANPTLNQSNNIGGVGMSNQEIFSQRGAYLVPQDAPQVFGGNRCSGPIDVSTALNASASASGRLDFESETFVAQGFHGDVARTLTARHDSSPCADRGMDVVAYGVAESPDLAHCLRSGASKADKHESTTYVQPAMQVRRLTPTESERLQGFPDGHTLIPWRGKPAEDCPDGPRYKALGNSMAVPVMRWIGERIAKAQGGTNG